MERLAGQTNFNLHAPVFISPWAKALGTIGGCNIALAKETKKTVVAHKALSDDLEQLIKHRLLSLIEAETPSAEDVLSAVQKATLKGPATIIVLSLGGGVGLPKINKHKCLMMQCYTEGLKELTPKVTYVDFLSPPCR